MALVDEGGRQPGRQASRARSHDSVHKQRLSVAGEPMPCGKWRERLELVRDPCKLIWQRIPSQQANSDAAFAKAVEDASGVRDRPTNPLGAIRDPDGEHGRLVTEGRLPRRLSMRGPSRRAMSTESSAEMLPTSTRIVPTGARPVPGAVELSHRGRPVDKAPAHRSSGDQARGVAAHAPAAATSRCRGSPRRRQPPGRPVEAIRTESRPCRTPARARRRGSARPRRRCRANRPRSMPSVGRRVRHHARSRGRA